MLYVLFHLGPERYALDAQRVVEIVPLLTLRPLPDAPRGVAGVFLYRGRPVPALCLCELLVGRRAQAHFSTRIIIVNYTTRDGNPELLGLIGERVTETIRRDARDFAPAKAKLATSPFHGPILSDATGVIQLVNPEKLVQESLKLNLFSPSSEPDHASH